MDNSNIWDWLSYVLTGGAGFGLYQIYDVYIRGRKNDKDSESEAGRVANESRDRDIQNRREHDDAERQFRGELKEEMAIMRGRISTLEQELKTANERYYEVLQENAMIKAQYEFAIREIESLRATLVKGQKIE